MASIIEWTSWLLESLLKCRWTANYTGTREEERKGDRRNLSRDCPPSSSVQSHSSFCRVIWVEWSVLFPPLFTSSPLHNQLVHFESSKMSLFRSSLYCPLSVTVLRSLPQFFFLFRFNPHHRSIISALLVNPRWVSFSISTMTHSHSSSPSSSSSPSLTNLHTCIHPHLHNAISVVSLSSPSPFHDFSLSGPKFN